MVFGVRYEQTFTLQKKEHCSTQGKQFIRRHHGFQFRDEENYSGEKWSVNGRSYLYIDMRKNLNGKRAVPVGIWAREDKKVY